MPGESEPPMQKPLAQKVENSQQPTNADETPSNQAKSLEALPPSDSQLPKNAQSVPMSSSRVFEPEDSEWIDIITAAFMRGDKPCLPAKADV